MSFRGWIWDMERWQCAACGNHQDAPINTPPDVCSGCGQGGYESDAAPHHAGMKAWMGSFRRRGAA